MEVIYQERLAQANKRIASSGDEELNSDNFLKVVVKECSPVIPEIQVEQRKSSHSEEPANFGNVPPGSQWGQGAMVSWVEIKFPVRGVDSKEFALMIKQIGQPNVGKYALSGGNFVYMENRLGRITQVPTMADEIRENAIKNVTGINRLFTEFETNSQKFITSRLAPFVSQKIEEERKRRRDKGDVTGRLDR